MGPTSAGKSELAVRLALGLSSGQAKKHYGINGAEVVSADSRQVYRGMDIGAGKITPDTKNSSNFSTGQAKKKYIFTHKGIPHYCIDVASPKRRFSVAQYKKLAEKAIKEILERNKIPILCGGTGFYIQAVIDGLEIPKISPDWKLRKELEKKSVKDLYRFLKRRDPARAQNIERENPRRLIRAIEIVLKTRKTIPALKKTPLPYPILIIGIKKSKKQLQKSIEKRLLRRLKKGMVEEVNKLHQSGISWKRLEEFGLEYRWLALYLQKKMPYREMVESLTCDVKHFAKRQMTWFKRDKRIHWIKATPRSYKYAGKLVKNFLLRR